MSGLAQQVPDVKNSYYSPKKDDGPDNDDTLDHLTMIRHC